MLCTNDIAMDALWKACEAEGVFGFPSLYFRLLTNKLPFSQNLNGR